MDFSANFATNFAVFALKIFLNAKTAKLVAEFAEKILLRLFQVGFDKSGTGLVGKQEVSAVEF